MRGDDRTAQSEHRDPNGETVTDDVFDALSDGWRRRLLVDFHRRDARDALPLPLSDATDADAVRARHVHLPKLDDVGLVDWDPESNTLAPGPAFESIRPLLETLDDAYDAGDDPNGGF